PVAAGLGRGRRVADVASDGGRDHRGQAVGVAVGRRRGGPRAGVAPRGHRGDGSPLSRAVRGAGLMPRHPFGAVNLIRDPIHGYVELTKRLAAAGDQAAGLLPEDVAEEDLPDTTWVQRMRRISQLQSARWVFPT